MSWDPWELTGTCGTQNQAPSSSIDFPINNQQFSDLQEITIQVNASDNDGSISQVYVTVEGTNHLAVLNGSQYEYTWIPSAFGNYAISAYSVDNDNASSSIVSITVNVEEPQNQLPQVVINSPINNTSYTTLQTIQLSGSATDNDGSIAGIYVSVGGENFTLQNSTNYTFNWTPTSFGTYAVLVYATDNQGATSLTSSSTVVFAEEVQAVKYVFPLQVKNGEGNPDELVYGPYVDNNFGPGKRDYMGHEKCYDGHTGTDIGAYPGPWAAFEAQKWDVVAAAAGEITEWQEGMFDQECGTGEGYNGEQGGGNRIFLKHTDGTYTRYAHLKKGSLTTKKIGDFVVEGEYLGKIGSSGNSSGPHLHFEVRDQNNNPVDPFFGPGNTQITESLWKDEQRAYAPRQLNKVVLGYHPPHHNHCDFEDHFFEATTVYKDQTFFATAYYLYSRRDDESYFELKRPDGTIHASGNHTHLQGAQDSVWQNYVQVRVFQIGGNSPEGIYTYRELYNGKWHEQTVNYVAQTNQKPQVQITSLQNGQTLENPLSIPLEVNATDADGIVQKVIYRYYEDNNNDEGYHEPRQFVVEGANPFHFEFTPQFFKDYEISAWAIDDKNNVSNEYKITVSVTEQSTNNCDGVPAYSTNGGYSEGSQVASNGGIYECKAYPFSSWCNGAAWAYEPGVGAHWEDAWSSIGSCSGARLEVTTILGKVALVPNPASNQVTVYFEGISSTTIQLFDSQGKEIKSIENFASGDQLDISDVNAGFYYVRINAEKSLKLIVE